MNGLWKWCSDHPWMTFFIVTGLIGVLKPTPLIQIGSQCTPASFDPASPLRPDWDRGIDWEEELRRNQNAQMHCGMSPLGMECFKM